MSSIPALNKAGALAVTGGGQPILEEMIITGFRLTHVLQVYTSAMMTIAVWDWLVCLKSEYERIWKRDWTPVKFLYLWTRYYGLACFAVNLWLFNSNFTTEQCAKLHYIIAASCMWTTAGSESILAFRTYAFLMRSKTIGITLVILLFAEIGFLLYVSIAGVYQIPLLIGTEGPCTASDFPGKHIVLGFWLAPVAFDLICTGVTLFRVFQLRALSSTPILATFLREGIFYFVAVSAVNVLNAAFMFQSNASIQNINSFLAVIITQVLCCRLVLNLRAPAHNLDSNTFSGQGPPHPGMPNQRSTHNIPLHQLSYNRPDYVRDHDFSSPGVKVQVDIESDTVMPEKYTRRMEVA